MLRLNRSSFLLIIIISTLFFFIYLIYTALTTTKFNSIFNDKPSLRFSYAQNLPVVNSFTEDYFKGNSVVISYNQIHLNFNKYRFKFSGNDVLIFLHIQKTAGTTFERFLVRKLNISNSCICEDGQRRCDCRVINNGKKGRVWLFSRYSTGWVDWACGLHSDFTKLVVVGCVDYYFRIKEGKPKKRLYLTTLIREPVERFISEFSHVRRGATWKRVQHFCQNISKCFGLEESKNVELDDFLGCPNNLAFNRQTRMLADLTLIGCDNLVFSDSITSQFGQIMLESAKKNLRDNFAFFGIKERMNESQLLFENIFDMRFSDSLSNWNISKSSDIIVGNDQIEQIKQKNQLDIELYLYANKLFNQRIELLKN